MEKRAKLTVLVVSIRSNLSRSLLYFLMHFPIGIGLNDHQNPKIFIFCKMKGVWRNEVIFSQFHKDNVIHSCFSQYHLAPFGGHVTTIWNKSCAHIFTWIPLSSCNHNMSKDNLHSAADGYHFQMESLALNTRIKLPCEMIMNGLSIDANLAVGSSAVWKVDSGS